MNNMKTAFVTGATGFLGFSLARRLVQDGWRVVALTRRDDAKLPQGAERFNIPPEKLPGLMMEVSPDAVFHLAADVVPEHKMEQVAEILEANIKLGTWIGESMAASGCDILVNVGTSWQHYNGEEYNPVCLYAATKQAMQDIFRFYCEAQGVRTINLILADNYGPGDPRRKLWPRLVEASLGAPLDLVSGEYPVDLLHVDDVVEAFIIAAGRLQSREGADWETWSVSSGARLSLKSIVGIFEQACGRKLDLNWGVYPYRKREMKQTWEGPVLPGWTPKISLEEGFRKLLVGSFT